jgi:UDP-MurNAc hydroxylase
MLLKHGNTSLIVDPWLVGSCYWRSWWNFPEASIDEDELKDVDYVILSHLHWDHWHGLTIKKYLKEKTFILAEEPNTRSFRDLQAIGVKNIQRVKHGSTLKIKDDIEVTLYLFGLYFNDSVIVLKTPDVSLLNANDAKIAGAPLRSIVNQHGKFDFAFRSHSSANARVCFDQADSPGKEFDDELHYARSFKFFMDAVRPRYAIPFASNHCHLHQDTYKFNCIITNPKKLREQMNVLGGLSHSDLKVMVPGSSWSSSEGFSLVPEDVFSNIEYHLVDYQSRAKPKLDAYYQKEEKVKINEGILERYFKLLNRAPIWSRVKFRNFEALYEFSYPSGQVQRYVIAPFKKKFRAAEEADVELYPIKVRFPAIVFKDAVLLNMFEHALISKRCSFFAKNSRLMSTLNSVLTLHEKIEIGIYPISAMYMSRFIAGYFRRWREIPVYFQAAWELVIRKKPGYAVEEELLKKT